MALGIRQPERGLVHHSDRGCQYASEVYRAELSARGIVCSMSRVGDCWDNAVAESFFATLKTELIHRRPWPTKAEARAAVHDYIGAFFNPHRRHSSLGYVSPMDFERQHAAASGSIAGLSTESGQLHFSHSATRSGTSSRWWASSGHGIASSRTTLLPLEPSCPKYILAS